MIIWQFIEITGNTVFDLFFNVMAFFSLAGWSISLIIGLIKRVIR